MSYFLYLLLYLLSSYFDAIILKQPNHQSFLADAKNVRLQTTSKQTFKCDRYS